MVKRIGLVVDEHVSMRAHIPNKVKGIGIQLIKTFDKIFWSQKFDLIANFSAHKHVRSEKDQISSKILKND